MHDDQDDDGDTPPVTVVMITRNRSGESVRAVERILALPERISCIVVDNGSTDDTVAVLSGSHPGRLQVIALGRNAGAAGRNVGVRAATTPYVAFMDDDSSWAPGALRRSAEVLDAHPRLAVIGARLTVGDEEALDPTCLEMATSPLLAVPGLPWPPVLGFVACAAVVRRDAFLAAGGFEERYGVGGEEGPLAIELAARGWWLAYVDEVTARHWPSPVRDRVARRRIVVRNELWLAWSRRRWASALRATARHVGIATTDAAARSGVIEAARHAAAVLRGRRPVERWLDRQLRLLD